MAVDPNYESSTVWLDCTGARGDLALGRANVSRPVTRSLRTVPPDTGVRRRCDERPCSWSIGCVPAALRVIREALRSREHNGLGRLDCGSSRSRKSANTVVPGREEHVV